MTTFRYDAAILERFPAVTGGVILATGAAQRANAGAATCRVPAGAAGDPGAYRRDAIESAPIARRLA